MATTLMRIGHCKNGAIYLETRHHDGRFPEIYTLDGNFLDDYVLADTFRPAGGPLVVALRDEQPEGMISDSDWKAAAQALLASIDENDDDASTRG